MRHSLFPAIVISTACALAYGGPATMPTMPTLTDPSSVAATSQPMGISDINPRSSEKTDIQKLLAKVVDAGAGKGEAASIAQCLSKPDQQQIGDLKNQNWTDLDGRLDQLRKDWQAKFGTEFNLADKESVVFSDESFPVHPNLPATTPTTANSTTMPDAAMAKEATLMLPVLKNEKPITLQLVNEGKLLSSWKINVPGDITADKLHENLLKRLTAFDEDVSSWPTEINEAYQALARQVLLAILDSGSSSSQ